MSCRVINIDKAHEPLLSFLFPDYSIIDNVTMSSRFITHKDITSKYERDILNLRYHDCIFISTKLFDEFWDEEMLRNLSVEFSRKVFKNRKTKVETAKDSFVNDCVSFIFSLDSEVSESINSLFESFGSNLFIKNFIEVSNKVPTQILISSMNTFITKILVDDTNLYYKKKAILFRDKIKNNFNKAFDDYILRDKDDFGLSYIKFLCDLSM